MRFEKTSVGLMLLVMVVGSGCASRKKPAHADRDGKNGERRPLDPACVTGLEPFYVTDRQKLTTDEKAIKNLQYFLSGKIVLKRVLSSTEAKVTPQHRLRFINGKHYETITVQCRTPGVVREVDPVRLEVGFDPKQVKSVLPFEPVGKDRAVFCLQADWPDDDKKKHGTLLYEDKRFEVPVVAKNACLYVMKESTRKKTESHKELKGVTLTPGRPAPGSRPAPRPATRPEGAR